MCPVLCQGAAVLTAFPYPAVAHINVENFFFLTRGWALEQAPGKRSSTKSVRVQEALGQCSQALGVMVMHRSRSWTSMMLMGTFQPCISCNSVILCASVMSIHTIKSWE